MAKLEQKVCHYQTTEDMLGNVYRQQVVTTKAEKLFGRDVSEKPTKYRGFHEKYRV